MIGDRWLFLKKKKKKKPEWMPESFLWVWLKCFSPLRGTNVKTIKCHILPNSVRLNTFKVTAIVLTIVIFNFSTLSGNNLQILPPKSCDDQPVILI